ncbi:MAG: YicC family protein, partial [Candidatus Atribacteria bacterium]|nr:YicC family protein [Candidatus Atribacteria bacterium]
MIKSMTGYGVGKIKRGDQECLVEVKTLNNKYCDIMIKNSMQSLEIEQKIEKLIKEKIFRGKVNVLIKVESYNSKEEKVILNESLFNSYCEALKILKEKYKFKDEINIDSIIKFKDIFQVVKEEEETGKMWPLIEEAVNKALDSLLEMRGREGKILINDIKKRIKKIIKLMDKIEKYSKLSLQEYKGNFLSKLKELTNGLNVDEGRIELEAAIFAGKSDITEEIIRTKSHLIQFNDLLNSKESAGRKMDFLIQEINREINTIGSKNNNLKI